MSYKYQYANYLKNALMTMLVIASAMMVGCQAVPVKEMSNLPVPVEGLTMKQMADAIKTAGNGLGWAMKEKEPGLIEGTLFLRTHMAKIEIPYTTSSYSINYKASSDLDYDATKGVIHKSYNSWVQNLNNAILTRLTSM